MPSPYLTSDLWAGWEERASQRESLKRHCDVVLLLFFHQTLVTIIGGESQSVNALLPFMLAHLMCRFLWKNPHRKAFVLCFWSVAQSVTYSHSPLNEFKPNDAIIQLVIAEMCLWQLKNTLRKHKYGKLGVVVQFWTNGWTILAI